LSKLYEAGSHLGKGHPQTFRDIETLKGRPCAESSQPFFEGDISSEVNLFYDLAETVFEKYVYYLLKPFYRLVCARKP